MLSRYLSKQQRSTSVSRSSPDLQFLLLISSWTDVALATGLYSAAYFIGSSVGSAVSGAIWTNTLPSRLEKYISNSTLALDAYSAPLTFVVSYPVGTAERDGMIKAYGEVQRLLCITGICLCVPPFICALILRNPKLGKKQSLDEAEGGAEEVAPVAVSELEKE